MARVSFRAERGRLDSVAAVALGVSRAEAQRAISAGLVSVDGHAGSNSTRLAGGELVEAELARPGELEPDDEALPVLFEDPHLMIVSKPAGLLTHPTSSRRTGTVVNRLIGMRRALSSAGGSERPGIVHRLDVGTSGAMLVAKDDDTHRALADMFRRHAVLREYLALARGHVRDDHFLIDAPLGRRRARIAVRTTTGRQASTEVTVLERLPGCSLLEARPRTGRTHQIRVHLSAVGHPILGDRAYGGGGDDARLLGLDRPFLHSRLISFVHPVTGELIEAAAPLPSDLASALGLARGAGRP